MKGLDLSRGFGYEEVLRNAKGCLLRSVYREPEVDIDHEFLVFQHTYKKTM